MRKRHSAAFLAAIGLLLLGGCAQPVALQPTPTASPDEVAGKWGQVTVFAASSLQDAFEELAEQAEERGLGTVIHNFGGSQMLAGQLGQGARPDVFASADVKNMELSFSSGAVVTGTQTVLATNRLTVVVPGEGTKVTTLKELTMPGVKVVLADPSVPVGSYSLQALERLSTDAALGGDFMDRVLANVVSRENNVRQVLAKVELGEADAGIVYTTDARSAGASVGRVEIEDRYNVIARYYIAPVKDGPNPQGAARFIEYVLSEERQQTLAKYGFGPADEGR
jgi:molybdate transport system substrate-binding protein